jgi:hypothetical protein
MSDREALTAAVREWLEGPGPKGQVWAAAPRRVHEAFTGLLAELRRLQEHAERAGQERDEARKWANTMEHERDWERDVVHCELLGRATDAEARLAAATEALRECFDDEEARRAVEHHWPLQLTREQVANAREALAVLGGPETGSETTAPAGVGDPGSSRAGVSPVPPNTDSEEPA